MNQTITFKTVKTANVGRKVCLAADAGGLDDMPRLNSALKGKTRSSKYMCIHISPSERKDYTYGVRQSHPSHARESQSKFDWPDSNWRL